MIGSIVSACGGAPPAPTPRPRWDGALLELVPAGATAVVIARPRELMSAPASRRVITAITSDERLERYRLHTGIDPRALEELVWADTSEGSILLVRGPFRAPLAVAEMGHRMLPLESSADEPFVRRGGHHQGARRDLIALSDDVLLVVTGAPALTEAVLARVQHTSSPRTVSASGERATATQDRPVLSSAELVELLAAHAEAPLTILAPCPLDLPPESAIGLLLARERALVGSVTPSGANDLVIAVDMRGEFPPGADANFRALVSALAQSDLGAAVGMRDALPSLSVHSDDERVAMRATLPAPALAAGLRILFEAEIEELVGVPEADTGSGRDPAITP